jgi:hypothetical protein
VHIPLRTGVARAQPKIMSRWAGLSARCFLETPSAFGGPSFSPFVAVRRYCLSFYANLPSNRSLTPVPRTLAALEPEQTTTHDLVSPPPSLSACRRPRDSSSIARISFPLCGVRSVDHRFPNASTLATPSLSLTSRTSRHLHVTSGPVDILSKTAFGTSGRPISVLGNMFQVRFKVGTLASTDSGRREMKL